MRLEGCGVDWDLLGPGTGLDAESEDSKRSTRSLTVMALQLAGETLKISGASTWSIDEWWCRRTMTGILHDQPNSKFSETCANPTLIMNGKILQNNPNIQLGKNKEIHAINAYIIKMDPWVYVVRQV